MAKDLIVALDFPTREKTMEFVDLFDKPMYLKVGMELFYACGPSIVEDLKARGHKIFLDLKLHDIPNTVYGGLKSVMALGVDMVNIHCAGGAKMTQEARRAVNESGTGAILLGVTMLTSTSQVVMEEEILINPSYSVEDTVISYAKIGQEAGLDGVVCSAKEAQALKRELGADFILVCPGIRPMGSQTSDQVRVVTPEEARLMGVDYIVVGRPITKAQDPVAAYKTIYESFLGVE